MNFKYFEIFHFLDEHICDEIIKYSHLFTSNFSSSTKMLHGTLKRSNKINVLYQVPDRHTEWIQLAKIFDKSVDYIEYPSIATYEKGEMIGWHQDTMPISLRCVTMIAHLQTAPGACLQVYDDKSDKIYSYDEHNMPKGSAVAFPSTMFHRVTPPTSGERISFSIWANAHGVPSKYKCPSVPLNLID
jgi:hypothetical protein